MAAATRTSDLYAVLIRVMGRGGRISLQDRRLEISPYGIVTAEEQDVISAHTCSVRAVLADIRAAMLAQTGE